jgi:glycosyltransferase involved in cell wall biosynthesis
MRLKNEKNEDNEIVIVTVGMCVKNSENLVKKAIESILNQDYPNASMEVIVVDGNSKDNTVRILKEAIAKKNLKCSIFFESSGLGTARQMVVEKAAGRYIVWVDADMVISPSYISDQVKFMEEHPETGIAAGKYALHVGYGVAADLENIVYAVDSVFGGKDSLRIGYLPGAEGAIYLTKAIRQIGGFDLSINGAAEDTEVAYRMLKGGWQISSTTQVFSESTRATWFSLWRQYVWYGQGGHYIFHKDTGMISILKMTPIAGFFAGLLRCPYAFLLIHKDYVFLLPLHYVYKRVAWSIGFMNAHARGYGHK